MKKSLSILSIAIATVLLSSCGGKNSVFTPSSSGTPYEMLVVVPPGVWERPAGRSLFEVLDTDVPGLPQSERSFRIMNSAPDNFDRTLRIFRNIIVVDIQDIYTQAKFNSGKDVYAAPQNILYIQSPNEEQFAEFVTENKQTIIDYFTRAEMNRQVALLEKNHNDLIKRKVQSMFGAEIWLPADLTSSKEGEDFFWASTNSLSADQNFVIYSYPYTDKNTFTKEYFVHKRDSFMRANIPGAREGMYMATDSLFTNVKPIEVQGEYALEARGLWKVKGDFMGGPYVSHTRLDKANNRIVTAEVFIYSPDKLKRNLMRRMEASLYTLKFASDKAPAEIPLTVPESE